MTTFLFWNLNGKPLQAMVGSLSRRHDVDVTILVESAIQPALLLQALNPLGTADYHYIPQIACKKVELYTRFPNDFIKPIHETSRLTVRHITLPGLTSMLLAVNHFPSKLHWDDDSQSAESIQLSLDLKEAERKANHTRTVIVGDLNMNPFDSGVVQANGLHAIMSRDIVTSGSRLVQEREYPYFYNPMWNLLGDASGPPGTYFYRNSQHKTFFWNMFDQVLVRPSLLGRFNTGDVQILDTDGETSLLTKNGIPDKAIGSDHLPLIFKLNL